MINWTGELQTNRYFARFALQSGLGCSKLSLNNLGLVWNFITGLKALKENAVQIFLLAIWSLDVLTRIGKIVSKRLLNKGIKKPGLKFTPELALIGLRTTGRWRTFSHKLPLYHFYVFFLWTSKKQVLLKKKKEKKAPCDHLWSE